MNTETGTQTAPAPATDAAVEERTSLTGLIDTLNDVDAPAPVSMVPQTGGWILVALLLAALLVWLGLRWRRHHRAEAYRRAGEAALKALPEGDLAGAEILLRRTAIAGFGRARVAGLQGEDWLAFLSATCPGTDFHSEAGRRLAAAPYAPAGSAAPEARALAARWIRQHRRKEAGA